MKSPDAEKPSDFPQCRKSLAEQREVLEHNNYKAALERIDAENDARREKRRRKHGLTEEIFLEVE